MGNLTYVFERVERKFLLTPSQYEGLMRVLPNTCKRTSTAKAPF